MSSTEPRQRRRQLSPEEKWQVFLEITTGELSQRDAARKWRVDVSTVIKLRRLVKEAAMAAFASSKPGRPSTRADVAVDELRAENARLTEALKELAIELSLVRGKPRWA
jgi:transposase-like protein